MGVDPGVSPEIFCGGSRHSAFFYASLDSFRPDTLGGFWFDKMDNFFPIARRLCQILLDLCLFFFGKLVRTSTAFFVLPSSKMMRFPGIKPIVDSQAVNREYRHECSSRKALDTQENTMGPLPNTMLLTLVRDPTE
jgi:hypothetical protein